MTLLAQALAGHWLIVDDTELCRVAAAELLSDLGGTYDFASDGLEALAALETFSYFGMFIDGSMPNMSGHEAVARVRAKEAELGRAPLPIIMVTGEPAAAATKSGQLVDLIVEKPLVARPNSVLLAFAELSVRRSVASARSTRHAKSRFPNAKPLLFCVESLASAARALFQPSAPTRLPVREALVINTPGLSTPNRGPMAALFCKPTAPHETQAQLPTIASLFMDSTPSERMEIERQGVALSFIHALGASLRMPPDRLHEVLGMPARVTADVVRGGPAFAVLALTQMLGKALELVESSTSAKAQDFDAAAWLGRWIERPQPAIGGIRPSTIVALPTGLPVLLKVMGAIGSGSFQ